MTARSWRTLSGDSLRSLVLTVIRDPAAPTTVRNRCHLLMMAIEKNDHALIKDSVARLEQEAERTGYPLPSS